MNEEEFIIMLIGHYNSKKRDKCFISNSAIYLKSKNNSLIITYKKVNNNKWFKRN